VIALLLGAAVGAVLMIGGYLMGRMDVMLWRQRCEHAREAEKFWREQRDFWHGRTWAWVAIADKWRIRAMAGGRRATTVIDVASFEVKRKERLS
jgi:hypothetical protein